MCPTSGHERLQHLRADLTAHSCPAFTAFAADDDECPLAGQSAPDPRERRVAADVENQVVARPQVEPQRSESVTYAQWQQPSETDGTAARASTAITRSAG